MRPLGQAGARNSVGRPSFTVSARRESAGVGVHVVGRERGQPHAVGRDGQLGCFEADENISDVPPDTELGVNLHTKREDVRRRIVLEDRAVVRPGAGITKVREHVLQALDSGQASEHGTHPLLLRRPAGRGLRRRGLRPLFLCCRLARARRRQPHQRERHQQPARSGAPPATLAPPGCDALHARSAPPPHREGRRGLAHEYAYSCAARQRGGAAAQYVGRSNSPSAVPGTPDDALRGNAGASRPVRAPPPGLRSATTGQLAPRIPGLSVQAMPDRASARAHLLSAAIEKATRDRE